MHYDLKKLLKITAFSLAFCMGQNQVFAATEIVKTKDAAEENIDLNQVSEAFGHLIGKNLQTLGLEFDVAKVIKGIQDSILGKPSPLSETECVQAISVIQENAFQKQAKSNLVQAEEFLAANSKKNGIIEIEPNKLQYKIEQTGSGEIVKPHCTPTIRYTGKFSDGNVFGASKEGEAISLDETLPGFSKAIVGMREGEKRIIYIHPELGYGTSGYLPPNSLLTFEIEIVKADTPLLDIKQDLSQDEIADTPLIPSAIR
ncbi:MAG: FKBP-type peptidyl-prolyl cis-trans isomerase [Chlamydiae bacterium]|jgi:peptidylprolyl isomerase|nr:FKBP-type peptidyl-prolyl cis-trans isomerase [Chlamydiota bacterium]